MGGVFDILKRSDGSPIVPAPPPVREAPPSPAPIKELRPVGGAAGAGAGDANAQRRFAAGFAQNLKNGALGVPGNAQTQKQKLGQ